MISAAISMWVLVPSASLDAQTASAFNLIALVWFALLALAALWFRNRRGIHKRLMLFAKIQLMGASLAHLLGHAGLLTAGTVIGSFSLFLPGRCRQRLACR
jgi:hypothetical protein